MRLRDHDTQLPSPSTRNEGRGICRYGGPCQECSSGRIACGLWWQGGTLAAKTQHPQLERDEDSCSHVDPAGSGRLPTRQARTARNPAIPSALGEQKLEVCHAKPEPLTRAHPACRYIALASSCWVQHDAGACRAPLWQEQDT
jgi:hypothetical protein